MKKDRAESKAYQKILRTACDLFYRNGYRATGINEIIEKSGVAKATFYAQFPSKESLALAYVKSMSETDQRAAAASIEKHRSPREKLLGILEFVIGWMADRDFRGCTYLNLSSEIVDPANPLRQETLKYYQALRELVGRLMRDLKAEQGAAWKGRDPEKLADDYVLLYAGAASLASVHHDPRPIRDAMSAVKRLLE